MRREGKKETEIKEWGEWKLGSKGEEEGKREADMERKEGG